MGHKWMIDVLDDLQSYAVNNDLHRLAEQLEEAARLARVDAGTLKEGAPLGQYTHGTGSRGVSDRRGTCPRA